MKKTILLVDDEPQMLAGMRAILDRAGYDVGTAASGIEAAARLKESNSQFDLLITDMKMPRFSGLDLIRQARKDWPATRSLLITAYGTVESAVAAMKLGAVDYILKPFDAAALLEAVEHALGPGAERREDRAMITENERMLKILQTARQVARTDATVLLQAESGTGKECLARFIHQNSTRKGGPFVAVNCAALPDNLLESELMGHEKGAFTGAASEKPGKFELANRGTILLDEIGEMAPLLQAKILRVLQEKEVDRIGSTQATPVDIRVVATTNRDLSSMVKEGRFRQDLFFRLNVVPLRIPPVRERKDDIPLLVEHFIRKYAQVLPPETAARVSPDEIRRLQSYAWPGNVRELENAVHRAMVLTTDGRLQISEELVPDAPQTTDAGPAPQAGSIREMEHNLIVETLEKTNGNRTHAANLLRISVRTLRNKLKEMEACHAV